MVSVTSSHSREHMKFALFTGVTKLQINTEYENAVRFMLYFIFKWENNGWLTVKGTPVKNQVLIRELDYYSRFLEIKWVRCVFNVSPHQ